MTAVIERRVSTRFRGCVNLHTIRPGDVYLLHTHHPGDDDSYYREDPDRPYTTSECDVCATLNGRADLLEPR